MSFFKFVFNCFYLYNFNFTQFKLNKRFTIHVFIYLLGIKQKKKTLKINTVLYTGVIW